MRFSFFNVARQALRGNEGWPEQWRSPEPKPRYDAVIVGAGGHGLATAYYLAKEHGLTNIAVLEKGWLGGGNTGRNTTIIRSNYLWEELAALYEHALKLWEGLSRELNYNVMYSPRGVMMLAHSAHDVQVGKRHVHANRLAGVDNEWLTPEEAKAFCPILNIAQDIRYPIVGAALQRRGGTARHDAVAWGYARAASARGVDIIENCEVTAIRRDASGAVSGVETTRGADRDEEGRRRRRRPHVGRHGDGGCAHAARKLSASGARLGAGQADDALRRDVEHDPRLHVAVGQGRNGHWRRHRFLHLLFANRRACTSQATRSRPSANCSPRCGGCGCCATGAASST